MADISIRGVHKTYGKTAVVHGLDLEISSGEFVVILGPSGCGKSTLLRMIAGLETITGGEIAIDGRIVNKLEPRERGCAMVFQNYALYPHMSVADNIGYALKVAGVPKPERRMQVEEIAGAVGLGPYLARRPASLSGGQRQRVAMARAMIRKPKVFLFDEPLSNLDAQLRVQMRAEIRKLHRQLGATSVFVTHDQAEAMTLADRLVVMRDGRIEQVGKSQDIYRRPTTRYVAGFVGSPPMNLLETRLDKTGAVALPAWPGNGGSPSPVGRPFEDVVLGIRPEAISIAAANGAGRGSAVIDFVEEFGPNRVFHLDWNGTRLSAVTSDLAERRSGETVTPSFAAEDVHVFSAETGMRLQPGAPAF